MTVTAVVLAAGQSSRAGDGPSKVLALFDGITLVRKVTMEALASKVDRVVVITGHQAASVRAVLNDLDIGLVHNERFPDGMGTSIACAANHLLKASARSDLLLLFADMPFMSARHIDTVLAGSGAGIVRGANGAQPGHPILFPSTHLAALGALKGDEGAKDLVQDAATVDIGEAATFDVDTRAAINAAGGSLDLSG